MTLEEDLYAEGEPEEEFHKGIAARLPRKRVAAGALIRDEQDRILFVMPAYKPTLDIPGGIAEENESPAAACRREVYEEIGLELGIERLLLVDWVPQHGVWGDGVMFIFDGGLLTSEQAATVTAVDDELTSVQFLTLQEAATRLRPSMVRRLEAALSALDAGPQYGEFGRLL